MKNIKFFFMFIVTVMLQNCSDISTDPNTQNEIIYNTWEMVSPIKGDCVSKILGSADDIVMLGSSFPGIYLSWDNGKNWSMSNNCNLYNSATDFAITSNKVLFLTAAEGLFKSTDKGKSWMKLNVNDNNGDYFETITAGINDQLYVTNRTEMFTSTDCGEHWTKIGSGLPTNSYVFNLITDKRGRLYLRTNFGAVYKSLDNGNSWQVFSDGLSNNNQQIFITCLEKDKNNDIYAGCGYGLWKLDNNSSVWQKSSCPATYINTVLSKDSMVFVGTANNGLYISSDNGNNWITNKSESFDGVNITSLTFSNNFLLAGTYKGVFRSSDNGKNWTESNNGFYSSVGGIVSDKIGNLYTTTYKSVYKSTDGGDHWNKFGKDLPYYTNQIFINSSNEIFVDAMSGLFKTTDNGETWIQTNLQYQSYILIWDFAENSKKVHFATTSQGIIKSSNGGNDWFLTNNGFPSDVVTENIQIYGNDDIFVTTREHGLYKSTDDGNTWNKVEYFGDWYMNDITIDKKSQTIYVLSGYLYKSNDGVIWSMIPTGFYMDHFSMNSESKIAGVGSYKGWVSNNDLSEWTELNNSNLPRNYILDCIFVNDKIYLNSHCGILRYVVK